ncbi:MAG: thermostable hemolysin [Gallionella sp.]|nr:thermostable hemolysin [Gallionella sp.]
MKKIISNPIIGLKERPFTVAFSRPDAPDRAELEQFIGNIFHQAYGAEITHFMPYLMSLRDMDEQLIAVCGLRSASIEAPFLERYLDRPIEAVLSKHAGLSVKRGDIIEVGNFSVAEMGMSRYLITAINDQLYATSKQWAVFTAVPVLRNAFIKLNMKLEILCDANKDKLTAEEQAEWGSYYEHKPQVMAIRRIERRSKSRAYVKPATAAA